MPTLAEYIQAGAVPLTSMSPYQSPSAATATTTAAGLAGMTPYASPYEAATTQPYTGLASYVAPLDPNAAAIQAGLLPFLQGAPGDSPLTQAAIQAFRTNTQPILENQMQLQGLGQSPALAQATGQALAQALPAFIQEDMRNRFQAAQNLQQGYNQQLQAGQLQTQARTSGAQGLQQQQQLGQEAWTRALQAQQGGLQGLQQQQQLEQTAIDRALQGRQLGFQALGQEEQLNQSAAKIAADISNQAAQRQLAASGQGINALLGYGSNILYPSATLQQQQQQTAMQGFSGAGGLQQDVAQQVSNAAQAERLRLQGLAEAVSTGPLGSVPSTLGSSVTSQGK